MKSSFRKLLSITSAIVVFATSSSYSFTIGYFDSTRELWGFSGGGPYLVGAKEFLMDKGYTLVSTNNADATFLSGVDAFYTGLVSSISNEEISAMQNFVDVSGGFLFIQQDHDSGTWHAPAQEILANWGITSSFGTYFNDSGHTTSGTSEWVSEPNLINGLSGSAHSAIDNTPAGFEILATDDAGRTILGVFDAGAGRSSDVLVATDIDFWGDSFGWNDSRNRDLWENIWTTAAEQTGGGGNRVPDSGSTFMLLGVSMVGAFAIKKKLQKRC